MSPTPESPGMAEDRGWARAAWAFVALGLALRLFAYALNFPIWWDEAFVAVNLLRRDYAGLLRPLDYGQVCPLLFLWAELAAVRALGFSEWSLRLVPLLCSLAGVVAFRGMATRALGGRAAFLATAIFAVSVHPIRHAADVKPYASDLLIALIVQDLAIRWWRDRDRVGRLWGLAAVVPVALLGSHPAAFVVAGVGLSIAVPAWRTGRWGVRAALAGYGLVAVSTYAWAYLQFIRPQASSASGGMLAMWARSFPPTGSIPGLARWLAVVHSGDLMAYPCGGERGGSILSLLACIAGAAALVRTGRSTLLAILASPLAVAMVAAALRLYPYGGPAPHGSAARIMQYAAPGLCLLIGLGVDSGLGMVKSATARRRLVRLGCLVLAAVGIVPQVEGSLRPYRAYQAEAAREFARGFWPRMGEGAEVACVRWDFGAAEWDSIRLGVAVMLANQAIYSPTRRSGGPRYDRVAADRPLRCVLGVAPEVDPPGLAAWLAMMDTRYFLRRRESIIVDMAEPGRATNHERFEVFEFEPRRGSARLPTPVQAVKGS